MKNYVAFIKKKTRPRERSPIYALPITALLSGEFSERPFRWDMYVSSLEGGLIDACLMLWPRASRFAPEVTRYVASCDQYGKISSNYNPQEDESLDLLQTRFFHQKNHLTYFKHTKSYDLLRYPVPPLQEIMGFLRRPSHPPR